MKRDHSILISRMLTRETSELDQDLILKLRNDVDFNEQFESYKSIWVASEDYFPQREWNMEQAKASFMSKLEEVPPPSMSMESPTSTTLSKSSSKKNWIIAITLLSLLVLIYMSWKYLDNSDNTTITAKETIEYAVLNDKSEIWLGGGSQVVVDLDQEAGRLVELQGQGVFKVFPNNAKPFRVTFSDMAVEVVGTVFKIDARQKGQSKLEVRSGKVKLYSKSNPKNFKIISEGEYAIVDHLNRNIQIKVDDAIRPLQTIGSNMYRNVTVEKILEEVEIRFAVTLRYEKQKLSACKITSLSTDNMSLQELFEALQVIHPSITIDKIGENIYRVNSGGC